MPYLKFLGTFFFCCCIYSPVMSEQPSVETQWSHRQIAHMTVDPNIPEGSLFLTFSSDQEIWPIEAPEGLEAVDPFTWKINLSWDELDPISVIFTNASQETTQVSTVYEPRMYLDPELHNMPVINIITAPHNLWDPDVGIYLFGLHDNCLQHGEDWERPAVFQYFDGSNSPIFSEQIGLRINGGYSRRADQKGLRFYFDDYGSSDSIEHDFFLGEPLSFQRLITRTCHWPNRAFNSVFAEGLFMDLGHLGSRNRDIAIYINNEYWGIQTLRERLDSEFIEHTHELGQDGYSMIKDGSLVEGNESPWWAFLNACGGEQDFSSHQWFSYVLDNLDLSTYMDWLIINIFGATADNGGPHNVTLLRLGSGPWQYVMFDEDDLFRQVNLESDFFRFFSSANESEYNQFRPQVTLVPPDLLVNWAAIFRGLMQNSEFKILFKNRFEELMNNEMSDESLQIRLEGVAGVQNLEMPRHYLRWGQSENWYQATINNISAWITLRRPIVLNQFDSFLESYRVPVELSQFEGTDPSSGSIRLNWKTESEVECAGFVLYRGSSVENMEPVASYETHDELLPVGDLWQMAEYEYLDEVGDGTLPLFYQLSSIATTGEESMLPWVLTVEAPAFVPALVVNEFVAQNETGIQDETGEFEDWVEIFNAGFEVVNMGGLYLTDNLADTTKWAFPDVSLDPGGFLLVWCDSDPEDGPLHTNFKLSASGEAIGLFDSLDANNQLIDSHTFGAQSPDVSEGRVNDGGPDWVEFLEPTPGQTNQPHSIVPLLPSRFLSLGPNYPNPFNPETTIRYILEISGFVSIEVFDINGRKIRTLLNSSLTGPGQYQVIWDGCDDRGKVVASGTYFAWARMGEKESTLKMSLIK